MKRGGIGDAMRRNEDLRLVTGQGTYADDVAFPHALRAAMVRSPHGHARILRLDVQAARRMPGVHAVLTGADALEDGLGPVPQSTGGSKVGSDVPLRNADGSERLTTPFPALANGVVRFIGQAVAMVVAETLHEAQAAAEAVEIDWEVIPAVTLARDAVAPGAPLLWNEVPGNVALDGEIGDAAATEAAFARAAQRVAFSTRVQRVTGVHLEPRVAVGTWDSEHERYTVLASHGIGIVQMRNEIAMCLGVGVAHVRCIAPKDIGGNFGTRNATYPEFPLVAWAARRLGRAVKHVADRSEAFLSDFQGRDLTVDVELALDADGTFLALRTSNLSNLGAHTASFVALNKGLQLMTGVYRIPVAHYRARAALTNTPSTIPYRSAGRPEAMYVIERLVDIAAAECGFDRVELRRHNLIPADVLPWRNPAGVIYDSGDYAGVMQRALDLADWEGFEIRRAGSAARGLCRGIAVANYIEGASGNPRERAELTILPDGGADLVMGTQNSGQGHETSFAQLVREWLGIAAENVRLRAGDTDFVSAGGGTHSGRSMRFGSLVIRDAADAVIARGKRIGALLLQCADDELAFADGAFEARDGRTISLVEIAKAAADNRDLPDELRGPLIGIGDRMTTGLAFPFGAGVCEVEVDPETGAVEIVRYTAVDDVGRAVNPLILHGQAHGGIAQGVGQALLEDCVYEPGSGQMLAASFMDYAMPRADFLPSFTTAISEIPATSHPLGMRPGGEGATTPSLGVTINAIVDALKHLGVRHVEMPATPLRVWKAIQTAQRADRRDVG